MQTQELGGVMHRFDKDGDGTVDVVEFTKAFFKMGFDERTKRTKERRDTEAVSDCKWRNKKRTQHRVSQKQRCCE